MEPENKSLETFVKLWAWAETNWRKLAAGAGVVALVGLVGSYVLYSQNHNAVLASQALSALRPTPTPDGGFKPVSAEAYLKVAEQYAGTAAAGRAILLAGGALFDATNYAGALKQFERFQAEFAGSSLRAEALFGQAASLAALGRMAEAATAFQALITRHASSPLVPRAKLALARALLAQQQPEPALRLAEEVARTEQFSMLGSLSEMLQEEIKAANPTLAARPALATNTVNILPAPATNRPAAGSNPPAASVKQ